MQWHNHLVYVHVLLFAYWLAPDWGVYVNSAYVARADLSVDERKRFLKAALRIDLLPRTCLILLLPVGLQLAKNLDLIHLPDAAMPAIWIAGVAWLLLSWTVYRTQAMAIGQRLKGIDHSIRVVLAFVLLSLSAYALATGEIIGAVWLALKVGGYGLLLVLGLLLRKVMGGWAVGFRRLEQEWSTPATEAVFAEGLRRARPIVYVFWTTSAFIAFLGVVKPF